MAAFAPLGDFLITYTDGRTATAKSNFLGLAEVEKRWPGDDLPVMTALAYAVWWYLDCPGEFKDFQRSVHTIEEAPPPKADDAADPTEPAAEVA